MWDTGRVRSAQQAFVPYSGPRLQGDVQYWWTVSTGDATGTPGPFARPVTFVTVPRQADWHTQWVTPGASPPSHDQLTYVRTTLHVGSGPIVRATAYVAASHQYQLWINGHRATAGPSFSYPDEQYVEATDVTALLKSGANGIGVLHHWYGAGQGRPAGQPGLLAEISVTHRDGSHEVFGTDGAWRETPAEWSPGTPRNDEGDFTEIVDGRAHPAGWSTPAFDDAAWHPIAVLGPPGTPPFTQLVAERTRIVRHAVRPRSVRTLAYGRGRGGLRRDQRGEPGGAVPARRRRAHGFDAGRVRARARRLRVDDPREPGHRHGYRYTEPAGGSTFAAYGYLAFRYLEVDGPGEPLTAGQLTIEARRHRDARRARRHVPHVGPEASTRSGTSPAVPRSTSARSSSSTRRRARRASSSSTPSTTRRRRWPRSASRTSRGRRSVTSRARSPAYWPDGRVNVVYPNGDGDRDIPDSTERYPDWVWQYYMATGDRDDPPRALPAVRNPSPTTSTRAIDPTTGLVTKLPGGGERLPLRLVDWPPHDAVRVRHGDGRPHHRQRARGGGVRPRGKHGGCPRRRREPGRRGAAVLPRSLPR